MNPANNSPEAANVSSQLCADFPKESKTREIQTLGAIGLVLSVLFLGLRVYSRLKIAHLPLKIDDWTAIAVTVSLHNLFPEFSTLINHVLLLGSYCCPFMHGYS